MELQILWDALLSLVPPLFVGLIFFIVMRGIFRADATERKVYQEIEAEMRAEQEAKALSEQRDKKS